MREKPIVTLRGTLAVLAMTVVAGDPVLRDGPIAWHADDQTDMPMPAVRQPSLAWDALRESVFRPLGRLTDPVRLVRKVGTIFGSDHVPPAANVNQLDEVPGSSWFTNRIGVFPWPPERMLRVAGPNRSAGWTVVSAKTEGVTPGFNVRDAGGAVYLIKFDPPGLLGTSTAAGVISGRLLHTAGYNVPEDAVVRFSRGDLRVGENVRLTQEGGARRTMTEADLDTILAKVDRLADGNWLALASKLLAGRPAGPFSWVGRREDDPNDRVNHEDRRELRAVRVFAAWLCHFDMKQLNTLDMYVEEGGRRFLRHHLIDFASTLGAGANGLFLNRCFEYDTDFLAMLGRTLSLGFYQDPWRRVGRPEGLEEIGLFESKEFNPRRFKPLQPNGAFANLTDRDGYWAAKIISAFTDGQLRAAVAEGQYRNPAAADFMVGTLAARRDLIARTWFDRIPPIDFFTVVGTVVLGRDLGIERGIYRGPGRYRVRVAAVDERRQGGGWSEWFASERPALDVGAGAAAAVLAAAPPDSHGFAAAEWQVDRGAGWSGSVTVYWSRASGRVVGVSR